MIEAEVFCGLALLMGCFSRVLRGASLVLFTCFLGAALAKALSGARSCGCLGTVPLEPWLAVAFDVVALAALTFWQPERAASWSPRRHLRQLATIAALAAVPILLWAANPTQAADLAVPSQINLGVLRQGQRQFFDLSLRNPSHNTVTVDNLDSSCPCLATQSLPITILPGTETRLVMDLDLNKEPAFSGGLLIRVEGRDANRRCVFQSEVKVEVK